MDLSGPMLGIISLVPPNNNLYAWRIFSSETHKYAVLNKSQQTCFCSLSYRLTECVCCIV